MKTEENPDFVPTNDSLMAVLRKLEDGVFANAAGAEVQALLAKLRAVAERKNANAVGKITLTLTVRMGQQGYATVTPTSRPRPPRSSAANRRSSSTRTAISCRVPSSDSKPSSPWARPRTRRRKTLPNPP